MDSRDRSIAVNVAFNRAAEFAQKYDLDIESDEGKQRFEMLFSYLTESVLTGHRAAESATVQMAETIKGQFPGSEFVPQEQQSQSSGDGQPTGLTVRGEQHGPLPTWLFEKAAAAGITEVYDNRDRAPGTKRPWFKATTGGDDAKGFWPPNSYSR